MLYVLVKEYIIDLHLESDEDVLSSTVDAVGYLAGFGVGSCLVAIAHHLGSW